LLTEYGRLDQGHAVVWSLFADAPDRRRDFLWRETELGLFYLLSARIPVDAHQLFDMDPPKSFSPRLTAGCRLQFSLHANPVVRRGSADARRSGNGHRVRKDDVVMNAIKPLPRGERGAARFDAIGESGRAWLRQQGEKAGFRFDLGEVAVEGYAAAEVRRRSGPPIRFHTMDFDGRLTVTDPVAFTSEIARGFGAAKAFGCGLMLIRRG
jgi:CRISPR system Cascade subunit CasE